jgi:hypothetical protein
LSLNQVYFSSIMTEEKKNRRNDWFSMGAFSVIALVAITSDLDGDLGDQNKETKWSAISLIIGLGIAGLAFFAHLLGKAFVGTIIEGLLSLSVFGVLAAGLSTIMDPENNLAQNRLGGIQNAKVYFFSWGALICAFLVFMKFVRDVHGVGAAPDAKEFSALGWGGFAAASFVVMSAATRLYKSTDCDDDDVRLVSETFCDRTTFAFSLGAIGGFIALVWAVIGKWMPAILDAVLGWLMIAAWCFGVGKLTFSGSAPAQDLGNLYFASWASFIMATKLSGDGAGKVFGLATGSGGGGDETTEEQQEATADKGDEKAADEKAADEEAPGEGDSA